MNYVFGKERGKKINKWGKFKNEMFYKLCNVKILCHRHFLHSCLYEPYDPQSRFDLKK